MGNSKITLAIESAIGGGSLALLKDGIEIASWAGSSNVSKAEDLLVNIDEMIDTAGVSKRELDLVAVSAGPGSFTGIRIGIATALGLKTGLAIPMASCSALHAIARCQPAQNVMLVCLPVGRDAVCVQRFSRDDSEVVALDEPVSIRQSEFVTLANDRTDEVVIVHNSLFDLLEKRDQVIEYRPNIASAIGTTCNEEPLTITEPIFISKNF